MFHSDKWWRMTGSNRRPPACKAGALPAELIPQDSNYFNPELVGLVGLEPTTPALSRRCSNQLSYRPSAIGFSYQAVRAAPIRLMYQPDRLLWRLIAVV